MSTTTPTSGSDPLETIKGFGYLLRLLYIALSLPYLLAHWAMTRILGLIVPFPRLINAFRFPALLQGLAHLVNLGMLLFSLFFGAILWRVVYATHLSDAKMYREAMGSFVIKAEHVNPAFFPVLEVPWITPFDVPLLVPLWALAFLVLHALASGYIRAYKQTDMQQHLAGRRAETDVSNIIHSNFPTRSGWATFENSLFVFNEGTPEEWSTEVDNIIVGQRGIYLVEAKYKSGTIVADPEAAQWTVTNNERTTTMRNALAQVRNQANALRNNLDLSGAAIIPIVAIYGNNVSIEGPSNVVPCNKLAEVVLAFEHGLGQGSAIDFAKVVGAIKEARCHDKTAMGRHIDRAQAKQKLEASRDLVQNAAY